jgi:hypothetical protein
MTMATKAGWRRRRDDHARTGNEDLGFGDGETVGEKDAGGERESCDDLLHGVLLFSRRDAAVTGPAVLDERAMGYPSCRLAGRG